MAAPALSFCTSEWLVRCGGLSDVFAVYSTVPACAAQAPCATMWGRPTAVGRRVEGNGSRFRAAAPGRLIEVQTFGAHPVSARASGPWLTASENEHLRAAVGLWQLYFETGRW